MLGSATFAIDVSSSSMKVASVTVTAMNHGLIAGFSVDMKSPETSSVDIHGWLDGHARPQQVPGILIFVEPDSHWEPLHNLHVVPRRVLRRKQAKERTSGARKALNFALVIAPEGVYPDGDCLARPYPFELRLLEVRGDPDVVHGNDHQQALSRLDAVPDLYGLSSDHAAHRRVDFGVTKIELSGVNISARLLQVSGGRFRFGASLDHLLWSASGGIDLRFPLDHQAAHFGNLLLSGDNRGAIGLDCLGGSDGFRFAGIVIGPRDLVLFDQSLIADAVPFGAGTEGFVLLEFMLRRSEVCLLGLYACRRLSFGRLRGMELAECASVHNRNGHLGRMGFCRACGEIRFSVLEFGRIVSRIELHQQRACFHELVILHSRIDADDRSADTGTHQVEVPFNLGVVRGLVCLRGGGTYLHAPRRARCA